jgi:hypothetical protein
MAVTRRQEKARPISILPLCHTILADLSANVGSDREIDCKAIKGKIPFFTGTLPF